MTRRTTVGALAFATSFALVGCGASSPTADSSSTPPRSETRSASGTTGQPAQAPKILTKAEVKRALISLDDLGSQFKVDTEKDDDGDSSMGCLDRIGKILDSQAKGAHLSKAKTKAEGSYKAATDIGLPSVMTEVDSIKSAAEVRKGLGILENALDNCHTVDEKDTDGSRLQLTVSADRDRTAGAADQVNMDAHGTITVPAPGGRHVKLPFFYRISMMRIDNDIVVIGFGSIADESDGIASSERLNAYAVRRLQAVIDGKTPPPAPDLDLHVLTEQDFIAALSGPTSA